LLTATVYNIQHGLNEHHCKQQQFITYTIG